MAFEYSSKNLLPFRLFLLRLLRFVIYSLIILGGSLLIGIVGYHYIAKLNWIDSFLNASMILTGMGPVDQMNNDASKIFASVYALYSGIAFLTMVAILVAPVMHRLLHKLHIEDEK